MKYSPSDRELVVLSAQQLGAATGGLLDGNSAFLFGTGLGILGWWVDSLERHKILQKHLDQHKKPVRKIP